MLQDIRKSSQSLTAKIIVGLIVVTFALFGVESIVGGIGGEPEVAEVNGEGITESAYMRALEGKRRQILAQMGEAADPDLIDDELLSRSVLEGLVEQAVLRQDAEGKDLFVADQQIDRYITEIDQFKQDGVFSNELMQTLLRSAGLTLQSYRNSLRTEFMIAQPRSALIASSFVLDQARDEIVALDRQTRTFGALTVSHIDYLDSVVVSDDEVQAFYDENKESYVKPESVDVSFIEIKQSDFEAGLSVTEEEIVNLYESEKSAYETVEERDASHILIKIDDSRSEEEAAALVSELAARLKAGEEFAGVAKEFSEDEGSAQAGGSLGPSARGVYVADFEQALFALNEGDVSEPVKTEFGYHLIKLDRIIATGLPELEDVRVRLEGDLKTQKAAQIFAEKAEQLADISYSAGDLLEPSEVLGVEVKELAAVSVETTDRVFSNLKVQRVLFSDELVKEGNNSELIDIDDGYAVVFRVDQFNPAGVLSYAEVEERIRDELVKAKAAEFAESVGQAFIVRVASGEVPEGVAQDMGLGWTYYEEVGRSNGDLNAEVMQSVFAIKEAGKGRDSIVGFVSGRGDFEVTVLDGISAGDPASLSELELDSVSRVLAENSGALEYRNYREVAQRSAEVEEI